MTFPICLRLRNNEEAMHRRTLILMMAAPLFLAGQERRTADVHYSYPMQSGSKLTVENVNGSIEITGWDQNTIDISATKYAETDQLLAQVSVDVAVGEHRGDGGLDCCTSDSDFGFARFADVRIYDRQNYILVAQGC